MTSTLKTLTATPVALALIALLAIKVFLLVAWGPIFTQDSFGYRDIARWILASTAWLHDAGIKSSAIPPAFRVIGYPTAIAAAMRFTGMAWPWLIVVLQFALSLVASGMIYRLAIELGLRSGWALFSMVAAATSLQLTLDQCILSDSFHASLVIIAVCLLTRGVVAGRPLALSGAALAGILLMLAFLMREALPFLILSFLPLIGARFLLTERSKRISTLAGIILFLLPLLASVEAYKQWNQYRTGERFVTTTWQLTMSFALTKAAAFDARVFDGTTPLDVAARRTMKHYHYGEVLELNKLLFREGYLAPDIARMAYSHYLATWQNQPLAMLKVLRSHVDERMVKFAFQPIAALCRTFQWASGTHACPEFRHVLRAARHGFSGRGMTVPLFFVFQGAERVVSIVLFSCFLIGVPWLFLAMISRRSIDPQITIPAAFWTMYIGWFLMYAIVHFEGRHLMPMIPFSIVGGCLVISHARQQPWRRLR